MMMMMDRQLVRQCDMEVMRMAMLKHEETFRQQVKRAPTNFGFFFFTPSLLVYYISHIILERKCMKQEYELLLLLIDRGMDRHCSWQLTVSSSDQVHELHRLYRIQRELMSDLITTRYDDEPLLLTTAGRRSKQPRRALDLQLPADEYIVSADEESDAAGAELELTLAVGGRCADGAGRRKSNRRRRQLAERQQRDNNAAAGGGSSPFGSDCSGASALSSPPPSSAEYYSDDGPAAAAACQRAVAFDLGGEGDGVMRQQHAPWLAQCQQYLSLRMT